MILANFFPCKKWFKGLFSIKREKMVDETAEKNCVMCLADLSKKYTHLEKQYKALAEREALLGATLENISDTVVITDDNGKFTFVCPNTSLIFGLSTDEVFQLGSVNELVHGPIGDIDRLRAGKKSTISGILSRTDPETGAFFSSMPRL
jgi:transcriptional regulator with PAS, ATPase and Fis domain